jgi:2-haloacid dehalogenase
MDSTRVEPNRPVVAVDPDRVSTVTFDFYSTPVDVTAAMRALGEVVADPAAVARHWRLLSLFYAIVANHLDAYQPFVDLNRHALEHALAAHGADVSADRRDEILALYHELDVFEDVPEGIARLREAGYAPHVLSNDHPEVLASMADQAGIADL